VNQHPDDEELITRIARGDRLAMQVLFARHNLRVFRFVVRLVKDEGIAEDMIGEVFLDVWRQAGRFEARSSVSTWLLSIARFKALSALRKRREEGQRRGLLLEPLVGVTRITLQMIRYLVQMSPGLTEELHRLRLARHVDARHGDLAGVGPHQAGSDAQRDAHGPRVVLRDGDAPDAAARALEGGSRPPSLPAAAATRVDGGLCGRCRRQRPATGSSIDFQRQTQCTQKARPHHRAGRLAGTGTGRRWWNLLVPGQPFLVRPGKLLGQY
jgi:RNA polymerase sigma factor (sigma-70 family)